MYCSMHFMHTCDRYHTTTRQSLVARAIAIHVHSEHGQHKTLRICIAYLNINVFMYICILLGVLSTPVLYNVRSSLPLSSADACDNRQQSSCHSVLPVVHYCTNCGISLLYGPKSLLNIP